MDIFELRNDVIENYGKYVRSFLKIKDPRILDLVQTEMDDGFLWPDPLIQLNPSFEKGETIKNLIRGEELHPQCIEIFRKKSEDGVLGAPFRFHQHQVEGIRAARRGESYVLTTGTGSGKSLSYIVPIVDHVLRRGSSKGIQAIIVYPMNALANSQIGELEKFLCRGFPEGKPPVTFKRYTGQESDEERKEIIAQAPDILLTNYVMLELLLTRPKDRELILQAKGLKFLVLDELHTYRGRQGADVAMLVRRVKEACKATQLINIGTSATLSSDGTWRDQQKAVSIVASRLFGAEIKPDNIIGETLRRATPLLTANEQLKQRVLEGSPPKSGDTQAFLEDPLSSWIESTLGLTEESESGRLVRCTPISLNAAAEKLSTAIQVEQSVCKDEIQKMLLLGYQCLDDNQLPLFAFRLHQFVSKGESVYASPESEKERHITLNAQQYVPGSEREKVLMPVVFCRECGQEYFSVRHSTNPEGQELYLSRSVSRRQPDEEGQEGYLYISDENPWPQDRTDYMEKLPETWKETKNGKEEIKYAHRKKVPLPITISGTGIRDEGEQKAWWIPAPFNFCLSCGVAYNRQSDFGKLASLGSEGRSTATTIMSLSVLRYLRRENALQKEAKKLMSFTDNRQDASLQAGHFNDFVEIALLRSGLWRAVDAAGEKGIRYDEITQKVFESLQMPLLSYSSNPNVKYAALEDTNHALREVIGYYLYRDLRRGWRITSPNLEQCGLLEIDYLSLSELCADEAEWKDSHPVLRTASLGDREKVCRTLLDFMRRELAIKTKYLDRTYQDAISLLSNQRLAGSWAFEREETLQHATIVFPRPAGKTKNKKDKFVYISSRGGFGLYLGRNNTFQHVDEKLKREEIAHIILDICLRLECGILDRVIEPQKDGDVPGYQINSAALIFRAGKGTHRFEDPIRIPRQPKEGMRTNPFFSRFYKGNIEELKNLEAREHTAQVRSQTREHREERFRKGELPILFCSPTMELGVDIAQLNVVNMRNIPPTPANYAQRSGRAGRSGQPAFIYSYCSATSPHDQYFFKRPENMVAGSVTTPALDLANEDLLRAHVHAVWLGVSNLDLKRSMLDIIDVSGAVPTLNVHREIVDVIRNESFRKKTKTICEYTFGKTINELVGPTGSAQAWLDRVLNDLPNSFENACRRWRGLYLSALKQVKQQHDIANDASRTPWDRKTAKSLRAEAEAQKDLLMASDKARYSDFYTYRYFASEGFLPGYNFPRLPLSAFIPASRRSSNADDEFLTRSRFLAISEFGPRSIIYHEGSRYVINKVILPADGMENASITRSAIQCDRCGYIHPLKDKTGPDLCEHCESKLPPPFHNLFRMQNVSTVKRERINSDEEERFRLGYEIKTGVYFATRDGKRSARVAALLDQEGNELATFVYGHAATIWRMNLGWKRRKDKHQFGYMLDTERGYWAKTQKSEDDPDDPLSPKQERVIPYVDDTRNCLIVTPSTMLDAAQMATLEAALKTAIQRKYQLEDREIASEALPNSEERKSILFYEASEGGAGVLRKLVDDSQALLKLAKLALEITHFDPSNGADKKRAPGAREDCEAACYDCLLSFYNQRDHRILDRRLLPELLTLWMNANLKSSPLLIPREEQSSRLLKLCQSGLEKKWVQRVDELNLSLPSHAQHLIKECQTRPDFFYKEGGVVIYVDGPHHDETKQREKDESIQDDLEDYGYTVIRFRYDEDWLPILQRYPGVFGTTDDVEAKIVELSEVSEFDLDAFDLADYKEEWRGFMSALNDQPEVDVQPGIAYESESDKRTIGTGLALLIKDEKELHLIDTDDKNAKTILARLEKQNKHALPVTSNEHNLLQRILQTLEKL